MHFTQEDYKKIEDWLNKRSIKDTEFQEASPLKGDEIIAVTQKGYNRKINVKDLVDQLLNLGIEDFINVTSSYDSPNISLEEAIHLIPDKARQEGQVITFLNKEGKWEIYQFTGKLNQWNNITLWNNPFDWENYVVNSILPDEEDLTKSLPDAKGNAYLSLKDRKHEPDKYSGLGRKILRKRIVKVEDPIEGTKEKNLLLQDDFDSENTIYEIRYDFDLNSAEITIPENCVLDFQGGSLNNGNIKGNNTFLQSPLFNKCILNGKFKNDIFIEWFGVKSEESFASENDDIFSNYIIPSMENLANADITLCAHKNTSIYFNRPIKFNGLYNLNLPCKFIHVGEPINCAILIDQSNNPNSEVYNYKFGSIISSTWNYDVENIPFYEGITFIDVTGCIISIDEIKHFPYSFNLKAILRGCSSNKINIGKIWGSFFVGIHLYSEENGWVTENKFEGPSVLTPTSNNPMINICTGISINATGNYRSTGNTFIAPNLSRCNTACEIKNGSNNMLFSARLGEGSIGLLADSRSYNNTILSLEDTHIKNMGDYHKNNYCVNINDISTPFPLLKTIHIKRTNENVCIGGDFMNINYDSIIPGTSKSTLVGVLIENIKKDNVIIMKVDVEYTKNDEIINELPFGIMPINDDGIIPVSELDVNDYILYPNWGIYQNSKCFRTNTSYKSISAKLNNENITKAIIGVIQTSLVRSATISIYGKGFTISPIYEINGDSITIKENINKAYLSTALSETDSNGNYFLENKTLILNKSIDLNNEGVSLRNNMKIVLESGTLKNGRLNPNQAMILPNYNILVENNVENVTSFPGKGTFYFQNNKPTWSNGTVWVDATGQEV